MSRIGLFALAIAVFLSGPALAQEEEQAASDVARLSVLEGEVSVTDSGSGEWGQGQVNAPLVGGDEVATAANARAELQLDTQNVVRLDAETQMRLAEFTREQVAIELSRGRIAYALGVKPAVPVAISTPNAQFQPQQDGFYVVAIAADGTTRITVRRGQGVAMRGEVQQLVSRGQTAIIDGSDIRLEPAALPDVWESWAIKREDEIRGAQSWSKLNPNYVGAQDLDRHGDWREVPEYGRVWVPSVVEPGWAPYREGYWVWKPYWGWVWVSNEPWGWTPYHYGRWVFVDGVWAWWPGPVTVTYVPVWAPAYVAFFDFRHNHHRDRVAWLPLGPADWAHPWWSRKNGRFPGGPDPRRIETQLQGKFGRAEGVAAMRPLVPPDRQRFSLIAGARQDARIRDAASAMPAQQFGQRHSRSERAGLDDASFRNANLVVGGAPAMPEHAAPPRRFDRDERGSGPRPAAVGIERAPQIDKPMPRPAVQPSAVMPQKIPGTRDATPQHEPSAPTVEPARRDSAKPFPPPANDQKAPAQAIPARPQPAPATVVSPPAPTRERDVPRERPATPQAVTPPPRPHAAPVQPTPRQDFQRERASPPSAPARPQMERPTNATPTPPSPPPQPSFQRPPPARVERPSPPPSASQPPRPTPPTAAPAPAPRPSAPARSEPPRNNAQQKNCGPKPCN